MEHFLEKLRHILEELLENDKKLAAAACEAMQLHDKLLRLLKKAPPGLPGDGNPGGGGPLE